MWYLACCDSNGECFGFLRKNDTVSTNPDAEMNNLLSYKTKKDANEKVMQVNLGHMLLPNGAPFRVTPVKG